MSRLDCYYCVTNKTCTLDPQKYSEPDCPFFDPDPDLGDEDEDSDPEMDPDEGWD